MSKKKSDFDIEDFTCDDTCEECLYIGEGDFICAASNEFVISDWTPIKGFCDQKVKSE